MFGRFCFETRLHGSGKTGIVANSYLPQTSSAAIISQTEFESFMTHWVWVSSRHPIILSANLFSAINSQPKLSLLPRCLQPPSLWPPLHLFQRSSVLQLFLCNYAYYMAITFMYVSLTGLLSPPRARVLSFHLCVTSKPKSMLCSQCAFSNHLLDE